MAAEARASNRTNVELFGDIPVEIVVELGRRKMLLRELAALETDDVLELSQPMDKPLDLVVGGKVLARGELVMVGDRIALRVVEVVGRGGGE